MSEFLFEIFCEEIPARMQVKAGADLSRLFTDGLKKAGIDAADVQILTGPRRLTFAADIPARSPDVNEERKGPRVGAPERALEGFLKAAGLSDISQAQTKSDKKGEFYVAITSQKGRDTKEILAELIPNIMSNFPWPKSMKSGTSDFRWVRPLQGMICLLGGETVEFEVGGIASGNTTEGHRRHGKGPFIITDFAGYKKTLEGEGHVILSHTDRKDLIAEDAAKLCAAKGLELIADEGLLNEVAGLAEWPVVILGEMDPRFLELPAEVIRLSMRTHQKYFAVRDPKTGSLAPNFIVVANQAAPDGGVAIAQGNSRVLSARLSDAVFFQSEDRKKNLIEYYDKLDTVVFHKKLGSIRDKAERVAALARELAPKVGADADLAEQAAKLAKCDLVSQTVIEFTSLQGQIGRLMYEAEGGDAAIATAIEDHYKPQGPSDAVPTDPVAVAVALADKLDTLVGFWAIDEKPTGSKDPFALRRAALGVVRIILENGKSIDWLKSIHNLRTLILKRQIRGPNQLFASSRNATNPDNWFEFWERFDWEAEIYELSKLFDENSVAVNLWGAEKIIKVDSDDMSSVELTNSLFAFILDRLKVYLRDQGVRHDHIDAVLNLGGDDLVAIVNRVTALQSFLGTESGENLLAGYKRAANILKAEAKKGELPTGEIDKLSHPDARALQDALSKAKTDISAALAEEAYATAMTALSSLRGPIDAFFDNVTVNDDDEGIRKNNLLLLGIIRDTSRQIADFDAIQG